MTDAKFKAPVTRQQSEPYKEKKFGDMFNKEEMDKVNMEWHNTEVLVVR